MLATFMAESWLNPRAKSYTNDRWICQLSYQFNKGWINDPLRNDWKRQADRCVDKWLAANHNIRVAYKSWAYKKYLDMFTK
jgi:hypothetical protein